MRFNLFFSTFTLSLLVKFTTGDELEGPYKTTTNEKNQITTIKHSRPKLSVELQKEGFHKTLVYSLSFPSSIEGCGFTLEQKLPAAVYVDTDELLDLVSRRGYNLTYPHFVDIEKSTEKSSGFTVLLHSESQVYQASIPIHFRYHSAIDGGGFVEVEIKPPALYVNCPNAEPIGEEKCFKEAEALIHKCNWIQVEDIDFDAKLIAVRIPRGDKSISSLVTAITIVISWVGCVVILVSISRKTKNMNKKSK